MTRLVLLSLVSLLVAGCSSGSLTAAAPGIDTDIDVVSGVPADPGAAALLPPEVRRSGVLRVGASTGSPPSSFYLTDNQTPAGLDVDITTAAARVLGLRADREEASFETILPALNSGKYQVGTGNFGVTEARKKTVDFVTYIADGQGFAVRREDPSPPISGVTQLCGKNIGTGAGTTFEATLNSRVGECARLHRPPYQVQVFSEQSALFSALLQHKIDAVMSTTNGLRYASTQQPRVRFLNEFRALDVGFAVAKDSPLAPALQAAVNTLVQNGTYDRILRKWGTQESAVHTSQVSPPEIR